MKKNNFIIVGDIILDRFLYGDAVRISPEAPALVLDVTEEKNAVGGAFNVFSHIASLGGDAKLISVTGTDIVKYTEDFPELTRYQQNIILLKDPSRVASIKTRLIAFYKLSYLARFDKEVIKDISDVYVEQIIQYVADNLNEQSSLLIVDYNKGVITPQVSKELIRVARKKNVKVYIDSKKDDIAPFIGAYLLKPNKIEFQKIKLRYQLSQHDDITACKILLEKFDLSNIVLTLGSRGMISVHKNGQSISVQGHNIAIKELSGAGDSVLAVLATLISEQYSLEEALQASNNVAASFISSGVSYRAKRDDLFKKQ
jgi:rfaE bifunctional protein kinase chain/domain